MKQEDGRRKATEPEHGRTPMEIIDEYRWEERSKIVTRDIHGVSGLMNFTYFRRLVSEPCTPMHYHTDILEIYCLVKGRRTTRIFVNGQTEDLFYTGGEALAVFPGEPHIAGDNTQQDPCEALAVQLNLAEGDDFLGLNPEKGRELCRRLMERRARHVRMTAYDLGLLREAFRMFSGDDPELRDTGIMHLVCFLYRYLRMPEVTAPLQAPSDAAIQRVLSYIDENISEPLPLSMLAQMTGYSLSRFKTRFREETGQTPALYVTVRKIEQAKEALESTNQSVTDVAYSLGWSSGNYFCAVFRKMTGMSPMQYRKQARTE